MADPFDPLAALSPIERMKLGLELEGRYTTPEEEQANGLKTRQAILETLLGGRTAQEMGQDVVQGAR